MKAKLLIITAAALLATLSLQLPAAPVGTAFTYQGRLADAGSPANGSYDLTFTLYDDASGGTAVASPLTNSPVGVTNGLFTVPLNFGAVFDGNARWLEIGVRTNGGGTFTTLAPRQPLLPMPYSIMANTASNLLGTLPAAQLSGTASAATNFSGSLAGDVTGTQGTTVVGTVGGVSAANVASGANAANAATSANTANAIVQRDASGNFSAGTITANLAGNGGGLTNLNASQLSSGVIPLAQLPGAVLTNNQAGVALNGTFNGNGAGLTNVTAAALAIPPGMVLIPAGAFTMGNSIGDPDIPDAATVTANISAFYMDVNLVSWSQWQSVYYWATTTAMVLSMPVPGRRRTIRCRWWTGMTV